MEWVKYISLIHHIDFFLLACDVVILRLFCEGANRFGYSSGDGAFWRPASAGPPREELLVAEDGRHNSG